MWVAPVCPGSSWQDPTRYTTPKPTTGATGVGDEGDAAGDGPDEGVVVGADARTVIVAGHVWARGRHSWLQIAGQPFKLFADGYVALYRKVFPTGVAMKHRQSFPGGTDGVTVLSAACPFAGCRGGRNTEVRTAGILAEIHLDAAG